VIPEPDYYVDNHLDDPYYDDDESYWMEQEDELYESPEVEVAENE
jgi:hypothetical protein